MNQQRTRRTIAALVAIAVVAAACSGDDKSGPTTTGPGGTTTTTVAGIDGPGAVSADGDAPRVFGLRLSQGTATATPEAPVQVVDGETLDPQRVDEITQRLPEWRDDGGLAEEFNWPTQSTPPPRAGAIIDEAFPPAEQPAVETVVSGPLEVVRFQPDGDVPIAPYVSITFNQPMVPIGTIGQVDATAVPATITPELPGRWQWIGTRTLRFDYLGGEVDRLPMATEYRVEVPAGTVSAVAGSSALAETASFTFATPPPAVQSFSPQSESLRLDQIFVAQFDQRVDPAAVLATITVRAGDADVALRLATAAEIAADDATRAFGENAPPDRWIAFRPVDPMPADSAVTIAIGPRTPSAEGPLTSVDAARYSGRTYAPLRIISAVCSWGDQCPPGTDLYIGFNNQLDTKLSDASAVRVSPDLVGQRVRVEYAGLVVAGVTTARTDYEVTIPGSFTDVFGQTLGDDETRTLTIGSASPSIAQYEPITTLDPFAESAQLSLLTVNRDRVRVRVFAAEPADFARYERYTYERENPDSDVPDWDELSDREITIGGDADATVETMLDLSKYIRDAGQVIVLVEPVPAISPNSNDYWQNRPALTWAQRTQLGIDAISDADQMVAWATDLRTGAALSDVSIEFGGATATTNADGFATLPLPASSNTNPLLLATRGSDTALMQAYATKQRVDDQARWYIFDDRQVYQPGETMRVKGWVRRFTASTTGQLAAIAPDASMSYTITDAYGNELATGTSELGSLGGFDLEIAIPETANLGAAYMAVRLTGESAIPYSEGSHQFQIQQYRRPEFEVVTQPETRPPFLSTKPVTVGATAAYYAGGPLAEAPVDWTVSTSEATYAPPGWDEFTFGIWQPWWFGEDVSRGGPFAGDFARGGDYDCCEPIVEADVQQYRGTTDGTGSHYLQIDFEGEDGSLPDLPVTVDANATVTDVNRQAWSSNSSLLVHAASRYVGLRSSRTFVRAGDPLDIEAIVTSVDGATEAAVALEVTAGLVQSEYVDGEWVETIIDPQTCTITSAEQAVACEFATPVGGQYKVTSVVGDGQGGRNRTELTVWVSGAQSQPTRTVDQQALTLIPSHPDYAPGDTAEVLVQAPFTTGTGMVAIARNGIRSTERFDLVDGTAVLQIPIASADIPGVTLSVEVVGTTPRTALDGTPIPDAAPRPAYAVGGLTLAVPPVERTLDVTVAPRDTELAPGASTTIDVTVTDAAGAPVEGAEFAVVVVDEAVLALSDYQLIDPLAVFYGGGYEYTQTLYGRRLIRLVDPEQLRDQGADGFDDESAAAPTDTAAPSEEAATAGAAPTAADSARYAGDAFNEAGGAVPVRSNFDALALFEPTVVTGADGTAAIDLTLPDNLTRYRVMVVSVSDSDRFGKGESDITARLPLSVRPSAPRFANFGDAFELPVVVQNLGDAPLDVDVVLETANLSPANPSGKRVTVPANGRVEVRFPVSTTSAGTAGFRVTAASGELADSATVELPVYTPATAEAFATYGTVDAGPIAQPVLAPTDVIPGFGGLEVTTSSTSLQALTDAVLYVLDYDYPSSDGQGSRIMTIAALREVLDAFDAAGLPSDAAIDKTMRSDIADLLARQNDDGGWPAWRKYDRSEPFVSVQVTHALLLAEEQGYAVSPAALEMAMNHLASIESFIPSEYGPEQRDSIRAYALWVRALAGQRDPAQAQRLFDDRGDKLTLDALAWIWGSIDQADTAARIERTINNRAVETASTANFTINYGDNAYLTMHSDRRTDGIVLDSLIANSPDSDLIPKVVAGLLADRIKGRWENIQENGFILLALKRYFDVFEAQTPDFVARVWLGDQFAGEHEFRGRTTDRSRISIPTGELIAGGDRNLVVSKNGAGRLYYRIGLRYAPADLQLDALDRGFVVDRVYEGVDDPADVTRDADGTWRVKAGARVRVRLTIVVESQRTHVALIDPLPAGLESLNPELAATQPVIDEFSGQFDPAARDAWSWWGPWYQFQQLRDDRSEAYSSFLPAGTYSYSYVARATTPGQFVVPPTRAEEMYAPETFGRTASDRLIVEE
jgi:uncharacterized protein YfaS (alpha-2-macroglobulin family)